MSDVMLYGVLRMPYDLTMANELSRRQFYSRVQEAASRLEAAEAKLEELSRATPPSPSTAPTQQDQTNVSPPFAAPASQYDASESVMTDAEVEQIAKVHGDSMVSCFTHPNGPTTSYKFGIANGDLRDFANAIELLVTRRCRAQGGNTSAKSVESGTAPTVEVDERAAFEAWLKTRLGYPFAGTFTNLMWDAWQGRASKPAALIVDGAASAIVKDVAKQIMDELTEQFGQPNEDGEEDATRNYLTGKFAAVTLMERRILARLASKPPAREAAERQSIATSSAK